MFSYYIYIYIIVIIEGIILKVVDKDIQWFIKKGNSDCCIIIIQIIMIN